IFKTIYNSNVPLEEMYRVFNMNIGFVVILDEEDAQRAIHIIEKHQKAFKIGHVKADVEENIKVKAFNGNIINF
ncbi:MAG: AIR synthase-related protein, partial [Methanobacterium sp.]